MKKVSKGLGIALLILLGVAAIAAAVYCYTCMHYWQRDLKATWDAGFVEKQAVLADGSIIHYAEGPEHGQALLLMHGQTGAWDDYARVLPELSKRWHVFAVDCYGHGQSSHDAGKYYLKENGDDLIQFMRDVIGKPTVVSGHSSGALLAAYIAAYGGELVTGAVLEDPPVYSTEREYFTRTFAYLDIFQPMHEYQRSKPDACWEAYYMRNCLWGKLYMASSMPGLANYAQQYRDKHPDKPVQYFFLPENINYTLLHLPAYDFAFGEHFYDYSWHSGIAHDALMGDIAVPTVFLHAKAAYTEDGILLAASSDEQARRAVTRMQRGELVELVSDHNIHRFNPKVFLQAVDALYP